MDVCGEARAVSSSMLLRMAAGGGIEEKKAKALIAKTSDVAASFARLAGDWPIRKATVRSMAAKVADNCTHLRADVRR